MHQETLLQWTELSVGRNFKNR